MTTTSTPNQVRPDLRDFYENPAVPVASGPSRTLRQARVLATALGPAAPDTPAPSWTSAAATAPRRPPPHPLLTGHRVVGVDWSQDALTRARTHLPYTVRGELTALPLRSASADAVLFSEVIEHLVDPDTALAEIRRVLRPGGHLMLSTPNLAAWYNRALLLAGVQPVFSEVSLRAIHGRPGKEVVGHLRLYTPRALREFVVAAGFTVVGLKGAPFHGVPRPLRPLDRLACLRPQLASILLLHARKT